MSYLQTGSTICFKPYPIEAALRGVAEAGFQYVELGAVRASGFLAELDEDWQGTITRTRQALKRYQLLPVSVSGHSQLHTAEGLDRLLKAVALANELNVSLVITYSGEFDSDQEYDCFVTNATHVADVAAELHIALCLENASSAVATAEAAQLALARINRANVGINYDTANSIYFQGVDPEGDVGYALSSLRHVHLKDARGQEGEFDFPTLGDGHVNLASILEQVEASGFSGPVSMEIEYDDAWPSWDLCLENAIRGRQHWDKL